jgi:hypothetical protein
VTLGGSGGASADEGAEGISSPAAVVVVVERNEREEPAVTVGALLLRSAGLRLVGAEAIVDHLVVLVDTTLHLRLTTAGGDGEGDRGE